VTARLVVKFGGELLESTGPLAGVVASLAKITRQGTAVVVVHGGGKEIDAALRRAGVQKQQVEALRITNRETLDVVVSVLAGEVNTRFVAALTRAAVPAVGLTGADGLIGLCEPAPPHRTVDGRTIDLGRVGIPVRRAEMRLIELLLANRFVPVVASIGIGTDGGLLNVNADTFAGHLAGQLRAERLVIAGTTPGVQDADGATIPRLDPADIATLVRQGTATAGMIAKLRACEHALQAGVGEVVIVDGRSGPALDGAAFGKPPSTATRLTAVAV